MKKQFGDRRSIRLKLYDYTRKGSYFITINTHGRKRLFGSLNNGKVDLSIHGIIAWDEWNKTINLRKEYLKGDAFIVMPDHIHMMLTIKKDKNRPKDHNFDQRTNSLDQLKTFQYQETFGKPVSRSIPTIVRAYKSGVSYQINKRLNQKGIRIWQRNYYERVIRTTEQYHNTIRYILNNPKQ
jgi:REP element-mobilizing transposase RayT